MTQIQSGILLEHCRFAIFMEAKVQGEFEAIRQGCKNSVLHCKSYNSNSPMSI